MSYWIPVASLCIVSCWIGLGLGAHFWRMPPRSNVYTFSTGQQVAALFLFEWLAVTDLNDWPPGQEILDAARSVGSGFTMVEIERIITAVRPMAQRAALRGQKALA